MGLLNKLFGTSSAREIKKMQPIVDEILSYEDAYSKLSDSELQHKTVEFKERLGKGETLEDILPEAFATVREASNRVLGMKHYPVQIQGGIALHQGKIAQLATGEGKANPVDTPIPTPDGWKVVGDIKVGDYLFDRHGKPTKVTGVYPQGVIDTYELTLGDKRKIKCAREHIWSVYEIENKKSSENLIDYITEELYEKINDNKSQIYYQIPLNRPVEYSEKELKIHPYLLGWMLGRMSTNRNGELCFRGLSEDIIKELAELANANSYTKKGKYDLWYFFNKDGVSIKINDLWKNSLGYFNCPIEEKSIPLEYKIASVEQRFALLQGLMDSRGFIFNRRENDSVPCIIVESEQMSKDILELIYSLGFTAKLVHNKKVYKGVRRKVYEIRFRMSNQDVYKIFRNTPYMGEIAKIKEIQDTFKADRVNIESIEKLDEQTEQVCFTVDNDEHLFLIGDYIVTHNTLTATLPVYLNALESKGVHVVTVNDYLAKRDSIWMGKVYNFLGLSVGLIIHEKSNEQRREAYACDITYGTNVEIGFDYLRDNMAYRTADLVQRGFNYCIIDEVDSILIDEARTPLIISGFNGQTTEGYSKANDFVKTLKKKVVVELDNGTKLEQAMAQIEGQDYKEKYAEYDYIVEEKLKTAVLTEKGIKKAEAFYGLDNLSDVANVEINHYITRSLKAHGLFKKDVDYVIKDGKIVIVDESTGRLMDGRRYSEGIHQAIEAKEEVEIQQESKTLASITYQNLFRKYNKLSGMTGTAKTEEEEFRDIYGLTIVEIPTNRPVQRIDKPDKVYVNRAGKLQAIVERVLECQERGQPVLIGTVSVEKSELLHKIFKDAGIKHTVLNAKYHEQEAKIVAQAGKLGAVTIATNMAGRGTDILLGGNPEFLALEELRKEGFAEELINEATGHSSTDDEEILNIRKLFKEKEDRIKNEIAPEVEKVKAAGGLYILGSERHESRRIDNQLRGRSGRQGDVGVSEFILSLEDDLLRIFGTQKLVQMASAMNIPSNIPIDMGILSNNIEKAQNRVESKHYSIRKNTLEYDDVLAKQRDIVYEERYKIMKGDIDYTDTVLKMMYDSVYSKIEGAIGNRKKLNSDDLAIIREVFSDMSDSLKIKEYSEKELASMNTSDISNAIYSEIKDKFAALVATSTNDFVEDYSKRLLLFLLDTSWQEHMITIDELRKGVGLRAYSQVDPLQAFKEESHSLFMTMMEYIRYEVLKTFMGLHHTICETLLKTGEEE